MKEPEQEGVTDILDLKEFFDKKPLFTVGEMREYYQRTRSNFKESAFKWRIHDLKQKGLISSVKRGMYAFQARPAFQPDVSSRLKKMFKEVKNEFPYTRCCTWETRWLNELMLHQPGRNMLLVEVESEAAQAVFHFLHDRDKKGNIYFKPAKKEIEHYIAAKNQSIIIKPLITQAPVKEMKDVTTAKLEKILVDLFIETSLFSAYQGQELVTIFENAYERFSINISTLFRYAGRRRRGEQLKHFLLENKIIPVELTE
jgi:hypothetical protein